MIEAHRRRQIDALFGRALVLEGTARDRFLARTCGDDRALHDAVASLLEADRRAGSFLVRPLGRVATAPCHRVRPMARPGDRVGAYRLIRPLGQGGMATVHLARQEGVPPDRPVALKLSHADSEDPVSRHGLGVERRVLGRLDHPDIVRLRETGTAHDGRPFLVLDWIDGPTIDVHVRQSRLSPRQRVLLVTRVCAAVEAAHESGVVHCDLKPANILVRSTGAPVLIDFGIATVLEQLGPQTHASWPGDADRALTPGYASPEQRHGGPITIATDVYLLGLLLLELWTGRSARDGANPASSAGPRARSRARLPAGLAAVVGKALAIDPDDRYRSAAHFAAALERVATRGLDYNQHHEHRTPPGAIERPRGDSRHS